MHLFGQAKCPAISDTIPMRATSYVVEATRAIPGRQPRRYRQCSQPVVTVVAIQAFVLVRNVRHFIAAGTFNGKAQWGGDTVRGVLVVRSAGAGVVVEFVQHPEEEIVTRFTNGAEADVEREIVRFVGLQRVGRNFAVATQGLQQFNRQVGVEQGLQGVLRFLEDRVAVIRDDLAGANALLFRRSRPWRQSRQCCTNRWCSCPYGRSPTQTGPSPPCL